METVYMLRKHGTGDIAGEQSIKGHGIEDS